ncbi:hypothetical protein [Pseudomonas mucidolens]|uniref:hypothetical protein n=1 Tax=Pseudomonas mucidolens TaxID=46679 RepID=UPI0030D93B1C
METNSDTTNPLVSYIVLISMFLLGLIPFLFVSASYGTMNIERWAGQNASGTLMTFAVLLVFGALFYIVRENKIDVEKFARRIIDIEELQEKKYIDFLLAHYGNVASIAAFFAAIAFSVKSSLPKLGITIPSLILSVVLPILFLLYGLVFAKTAFGAIKRHITILFSLILMLFLDVTLFTMAIKSIPKV